MTRNFILPNSESKKYWSIKVSGKYITTCCGDLYNKVGSFVDECLTEEKSRQYAQEMIDRKRGDGYEEVPLHIPGIPIWDLWKIIDTRDREEELLIISAHQSIEFMRLICSLTSVRFLDIKDLVEIPPNINQLTNLKSLDIDESPVLTIIPEEIGQLKELEILTIRRTSIKNLPSSIGNLSQLAIFNIWDNPHLESLPSTMNQLSELENLWIMYNRERDSNSPCTPLELPADLFEGLHKLVDLDLSYNELEYIPESLANCKALKRLKLRNSRFEEVPLPVFTLTNLEELDMSNAGFPTSIPADILQLQHLKTFYFEDDSIKNIPFEVLDEGLAGIRRYLTQIAHE